MILSGLGANGVREDQDRNLTAMADAAAASLAQGGAGPAAVRPLLVADLRSSTEPFLLVLATNGAVRYSSGLLDGSPRIMTLESRPRPESSRIIARAGEPGWVISSA